jgi:hypothetical protein
MEMVTLQRGTQLYDICKLVSKKKRAILATPSNTVRISGTYWDEGSRREYFLIDLATMRATPLPSYGPPQFGGPLQDPVNPLEDGYAIVCAGISCGKPATPVVFLPKV